MPMGTGQKSKEKGARRPLVLLLATRPMRLAAASFTARLRIAVRQPCRCVGLRSHRWRDMNFARRPIPRESRGGLTARLPRAAQQLYRSSPK